jgi:RNA polymerase sigma-70 factor (ECF subfamily)
MMLVMDRAGTSIDVLTLTDEALLAHSLSHPTHFSEIMRRYEAPFLRKAESVLRNREDAEDVVQETFTKIYLHAKSFQVQEGASFKSWGYAILMNTAFTLYKKKKRKWAEGSELDPEWYEALPDLESKQFEKQELSDYLISLFSRMPEHFVRVLKLQFIEGKSQEEIAEAEGLTVGAVKTRVHRAKKALEDAAREDKERTAISNELL